MIKTAFRQGLQLDPAGDIQLGLHAFLPGCFFRQGAHIFNNLALHQIQTAGQIAQFVPGLYPA